MNHRQASITALALVLGCLLVAPPPAAAWAEEDDDRQKRVVNSIGMRLMLIPAGKFTMGSPLGQPGRQDRETQRDIEIVKPLYIGACEVTQAEFAAVMKTNPSRFGRAERAKDPAAGERFDRHPVDSVDWHTTVKFCEALSALEAERIATRRYRLPTEAEWEYACRAGAKGLWGFGDDKAKLADHAWHRTRASAPATSPVGSKLPNAWGLYDTHGNVWEWCSDWYRESPDDEPTKFKVIRGGAFGSIPAHTRCATRFHDPPELGDDDVGFRVVMEVESPASQHAQ